MEVPNLALVTTMTFDFSALCEGAFGMRRKWERKRWTRERERENVQEIVGKKKEMWYFFIK
jgi:hypothetical protein